MSALHFYLLEVKQSLHRSREVVTSLAYLQPIQQMPTCPHNIALEILNYICSQIRPKMSLPVVLRMYDCHVGHEEFGSLTKRNMIVTVTEPKEIVSYYFSPRIRLKGTKV